MRNLTVFSVDFTLFYTYVFARVSTCAYIDNEDDSSSNVLTNKEIITQYLPRYQDILFPPESDLLHKLMPELGQSGCAPKIVRAVCCND